MIQIIDIFLHLDNYLSAFVQSYDVLIYLLVFMIIFLETGVVIFPFLPGDSLLFAVGALSGAGLMNIWVMVLLLPIAAILGDFTNYSIGRRFGDYILKKNNRKFITKDHLAMTHDFYDKYGNKTILFARFVPIVRTLAPFVAGVGHMKFYSFFKYNVVGGILWVAIFLFAGFFFGNIPIIKQQIHWVILAIVIISLIPVILRVVKSRLKKTN